MCLLQGPDGYPGSFGEPGLAGAPGEKVPEKLQRKVKAIRQWGLRCNGS